MDRTGIWLGGLVAAVIAGAVLVLLCREYGCASSVEDEGGIVLLLEAEQARDQALEVLRRRVDGACVAGATVEPRGDKGILVKLPGVSDTERTRRLLLQTARLEFKIADDRSDFIRRLEEKLPEGIRMDFYKYNGVDGQPVTEAYLAASGEGDEGKGRLLNFLSTLQVPAGREIALSRRVAPQGVEYRTCLLRSRPLLTGASLKDAWARTNPDTGWPEVFLVFDEAGTRIFENVTAEHTRERLAIILDGEVTSAPIILTRIPGGRARLTLPTSQKFQEALVEAKDLAVALRSGVMPASVRLVEERIVEPPSGNR